MPPRSAAPKVPARDLPAGVYRARRAALLKALDGAAGVVLAGEPAGHGPFHASEAFFYLTGVQGEPGAAVLFDPSAVSPKRRVVLFLKPRDVEREHWDGARPGIDAALRARLAVETVMRTGSLPALLTAAGRRTKKLAALHPVAVYPAPASPDLALLRQVAERVPGCAVVDETQLLARMRVVKSSEELALMTRAIDITAAGFKAVAAALRPGINEKFVERLLKQTYADHDADGEAYETIAGGGANAAVLHYVANDQPLNDGELLLVDSGAMFGGYAADVTRTLPIGGAFSDEQRDAYELVYKAMLAAFGAIRPGTRWYQVDDAAREVFDKAGHGDRFTHGVGHSVGLHVHDVDPELPLAPGMVFTVEPGMYLPERKLGVRLEDDVLVTRGGMKNLTAMIPIKAKDVERAMRQ